MVSVPVELLYFKGVRGCWHEAEGRRIAVHILLLFIMFVQFLSVKVQIHL